VRVCLFAQTAPHSLSPGPFIAAAFALPDTSSMDPFRELGRSVILIGLALVVVGGLLYFGAKLPFRLGRFPGDIVHRSEHTTFYFPIVTCLLLSIGLSLLVWLVNHFRR